MLAIAFVMSRMRLGGYERMVEDGAFTWSRPYWEQPPLALDSMFRAGALNWLMTAVRRTISRSRTR
jgi:hypothetical protein